MKMEELKRVQAVRFPERFRRRLALAGGLLMTTLLLQGCIYLRLLKTKQQLADFDQNIDIVSSVEGLGFVLRNPHLTANDLNRLGIFPAETLELEGRTIWKSGFEKIEIDGSQVSSHDLWLHLTIRNQLLTEITVPAKYVQAFTAPLIVDIVRAFGGSKIHAYQKVIAIEWDRGRTSVDFITRERIESVLGEPHEIVSSQKGLTMVYHYRKPDIVDDDEARKRYTIELQFDEAGLTCLKTRAIRIDFDEC